MRRRLARATRPLLAIGAAALLAGCGKTAGQPTETGGPVRSVAPVATEGAVSVTTRNTSRIGGAGPTDDAAAVARVVYPGQTSATRPQAVVVVDEGNWPAALAASGLAAAPLNAPILFAEGGSLPQVSSQALEAMRPTGAAAIGGAQVIEVGTHASVPGGYRVSAVPAGEPAAAAAAIESLLARAAGARPRQAIVLASGGAPALQMPAAGLSAQSGAPILFATQSGLPAATSAALTSMHHPAIYVIGSSGLTPAALGALARLGTVTRIPEAAAGESPTPAAGAISVARFTDGTFGWGVKEPGHGLAFANASRPLDAPAAALLSATGDYAPLLLLETADAVPPELASYLSDIQPAYSSAPEFRPVRGVYNHGWLIGDEHAISLVTQSELDSLLEIAPRKQGGAEEATGGTAE